MDQPTTTSTRDADAPSGASLAAAQSDLALLNADELEAVQMFVTKLLSGKAKHGALDLDSDDRDWLAELAAEQMDGAFYVVFWLLQRKRQQAKAAAVAPDPVVAGLRELRDSATYAEPVRPWGVLEAFDVSEGGQE